MRIKILFDCRCCQIHKNRGIDNYFQGIISSLLLTKKVSASLLISQDLPFPDLKGGLQSLNILKLEDFNKVSDKWDFLFKGDFFDVPLSDAYPISVLQHCENIVGILYDLIPYLFPQNYLTNPVWVKRYCGQIEAAKYASHVFCISRQTFLDAKKYLMKADSELDVIYAAIPQFQNDVKKNSVNNNCIAILGNDRRKGYVNLVKAFVKLHKEKRIPVDARLFILCSGQDQILINLLSDLRISRQELNSCVTLTGFITEEKKNKLLREAKFSIFPSFYEGLGLPVLESYSVKTPVIASSNSSLKELIPKECGFDPYDVSDICRSIEKMYRDSELRRLSIDFGSHINKQFDPKIVGEKVYSRLLELKKDKLRSNISKIAVFCALPPAKTGIALYTYKTHISHSENWDMFSNIQSPKDYSNLLKEGDNIFPLDFFDHANFKCHYMGKLFVLGNSDHHFEIIQKAIQTKGEKNRALYLHEAFLFGLFSPYFKSLSEAKNFLIKWYPQIKGEIFKQNNFDRFYQILHKHKAYMVKPLVELTGIKHIIVNSEKCKQMVLSDLQHLKDVRIDIMYLPIPKILNKKVSVLGKDDCYRIGSFGIPAPQKKSMELLQAVELLNQSGMNINLIFAGYSAKGSYIDIGKKFVKIIDNPSDEELFDLMGSVDLAVQLRDEPTNGESSGCIAQLLGLGQNILATDNIIPSVHSKFVHKCSAVDASNPLILSEYLRESLYDKKSYDPSIMQKQYGFEALSLDLYKKLKDFFIESGK